MKFFGVADGHGHYGGEVSAYVKCRLPSLLAEDPNLFVSNKHALSSATNKLAYDLMQCGIDANFSGTTLISVLIDDKKLWCANCGDSRALLARQLSGKESNRHWMSIALSRDHKPDERDEATRIITSGGRIDAF
jgi:serine/threonine protein phosphatase PrpC